MLSIFGAVFSARMGLFKNSREIFFPGDPPCFEKIHPPLPEKKVDPLPWAEGACPPMFQMASQIGWAVKSAT